MFISARTAVGCIYIYIYSNVFKFCKKYVHDVYDDKKQVFQCALFAKSWINFLEFQFNSTYLYSNSNSASLNLNVNSNPGI